jgi:hypothetical protein
MPVTKKKIRVHEFVADINAGIDDRGLMAKYGLTDRELKKIFQKLIEANFITDVELWERSKLSETGITKAYLEAQEAIDELD